ncbi:MAG: hypothetical protein SFZ23_10460 [Planctomycetota bacterium]|nr:hypothetical protein [Planctomycetota bacterium]
MLRVISLVVLLFSVTLISGCGKPEDPFIGAWQVHEADTRASIEDAIRKEENSKDTKATEDDLKEGLELVWEFIRAGELRYEIRADKTFTLTSKGKAQEHGTWSLKGSTMTFAASPESFLKRSKPYTATVNGGRLRVDYGTEKGEVLVFEPTR